MTERYQFHFRHILKDGTVLKAKRSRSKALLLDSIVPEGGSRA